VDVDGSGALQLGDVQPTRSDTELVAAVAEGDRGALGVLYDRFAPLVLGVGRRILRTESDAEDLLHDVFIEVWRHAHEFDTARGTVRAWVMMRARSRALDRVKSASYSRGAPIESASELMAPDRSQGVGVGFDAAVVARALDNLSDDQRIVLEMGYFEGLSLSEIADRLAVPVGTIKSRLSRALGRLREIVIESSEP
jgi:RNA polymerase sigma-70 factor (ECF subfamily)